MRFRVLGCWFVRGARLCRSGQRVTRSRKSILEAVAAAARSKERSNNAPSGKITVEHQSGSLEALARSRAAAGDCPGALEAFDAALESFGQIPSCIATGESVFEKLERPISGDGRLSLST